LDAGEYVTHCSGGDASSSTITYIDGTFSVQPAPTYIIVTCNSATYDGSPQEPCAGDVLSSVDDSYVANASLTYSNNVDAGSASVDALFAGDSNHASSTATATFDISPATPIVTADTPANIVYGDTLPTIGFTTDVPVAWDVLPTCAVYLPTDSMFVTPLTGVVDAGSYVTHCESAGLSNLNPTYVDGSLVVQAADSYIDISCPSEVPYSGTVIEPCTASAYDSTSGASLGSAILTYGSNIDAGTGTVDALFWGFEP